MCITVSMDIVYKNIEAYLTYMFSLKHFMDYYLLPLTPHRTTETKQKTSMSRFLMLLSYL